MKPGKVIVISGPSGVGKTRLYRRLLSEMPGELRFSISATTRRPRDSEADGVDYYFIGPEDFKTRIEKGDFIEWAEVYGNYYGTLKSEVQRITDSGKNCLLDVDIQGGMSIKKAIKDSVLIFILPPSLKELEHRLKERRTDDSRSVRVRIRTAKK